MTKSERQIIFEIKNFKIWASDDVPLKRYWRVRQDLCECAMGKRHVAALLALRLLARERVQNRPSKQSWMCNGYRECGCFVLTTVLASQWVNIVRQVLSESAMDIRHIAVLLTLWAHARQWMTIVRQDLYECAMDIREVAVWLALGVLARQLVHIVRQD